MKASLLTVDPVAEPVTLSEAKAHMRVDHDYEDTRIAGLILAARAMAENYMRRALVTQTWEMRFDHFQDVMRLERPPLQSVTSVKYLDVDGNEQTVDSSVYDVDTYSAPGRVVLGYDQTWPTPRVVAHAVRITYVAGYGLTAITIPEPIRQGILMLVGTLYEIREYAMVGRIVTPVTMPASIEALFGPYRIATP